MAATQFQLQDVNIFAKRLRSSYISPRRLDVNGNHGARKEVECTPPNALRPWTRKPLKLQNALRRIGKLLVTRLENDISH